METRTWTVEEPEDSGRDSVEDVSDLMESVVDYLDHCKLPITVTIVSGEQDKDRSRVLELQTKLLELSVEERSEVLSAFCRYCSEHAPNGCSCWNDE